MENNSPFVWDKYSDQPYPIKDKAYKKQKRKENLFDTFNLLLVNIFIFPLAVLIMKFFKAKKKDYKNFFGMCVNLDKGEQQVKLVEGLGIDDIQIRVFLKDIEKLDEYVSFAKKFKDKNILITIIQDREFIEDKERLKESCEEIFLAFKNISNTFQIGNAINRTKWGFFSVKEYLEFYKVIYDLRNEKFKDIKLTGASVIDFEYHYTIRALFNNFNIFFDKNSSLLYVDRRGQPENTQMGIFDTTAKIDFLYSLCSLSAKTSNDIIISEVNWPISNTAPYAPTSEKECVSEDDYTNFMLRYYFLCFASSKVQTVYWHQLVASGYGLIDTRKGFRKRKSFDAFVFMVKMLKNAKLIEFKNIKGFCILSCENGKNKFDILWTAKEQEIELSEFSQVFDKYGQELKGELKITQSPIYAI